MNDDERLTVARDRVSGMDRLIEMASRRTAPAARDPEAVLREALVVGRARARAASRRRGLMIGVSAALVAAALFAIAYLPAAPEAAAVVEAPPSVPSEPAVAAVDREPATAIALALLGAHRVEALPASELELASVSESVVALRLSEGAALFDVAPLGAQGTFEVRTPDATVTVRGTVFAVTVASARTRVEVFEGRVEVRDARGTRSLGEGESYATEPALQTPAELALRGVRAARARARAAADAPITAPIAASGTAPASATMPPRSTVPASASVDLAGLRAMCDRGEFERALAAIEGVTAPRAERGDWALVEGDAHRALGHVGPAAEAYERAASSLSPTRAALAGFLAATQRERAGEATRALEVLDRTHAAERGSPLEERALAMRASLLAQIGREDESRTAARTYLASFPGGEAIARMEALLAE